MITLLTSPEAWAALLTLTALEIVLGIDNVIFISVIVSAVPAEQAKRARQIGLTMALAFRILLLSLLVWLIGLTRAVVTVQDLSFSWRDIILIAGKGHEAYQEFSDHTIPFDDIQVARQALDNHPLAF